MYPNLIRSRSALLIFLLSLVLCGSVRPQSFVPVDQVRAEVDSSDRVTLRGSVHPSVKLARAIGELPRGQKMERIILVLAPSPAQEDALAELLRAQQDPGSSEYHRWLTPEEFGNRFGASTNDVATVSQWLADHGLQLDELPASRRTIVFSGAVEHVEAAFHTSIQRFVVRGENHFANASEIQIPRALAPVIRGVLSLHDFRSAPQISPPVPMFTISSGMNFLSPLDWDAIYDVNPLLTQSIDGTGVSIAVLGRVDVSLSDVRAFRSEMALPANDPQIILNGPDPGVSNSGDQMESSLDVEWAGAIARKATVKFITSKSGAADGIALSAQYAVANNVAPIITLSYGLCEAASGSAGNAFWNALWSQAAAQGQSVFVSAGDSGAAGCDASSSLQATYGRGVNALCSSPYSTCVGGTSFNDAANPKQYWSTTNRAGMSSALGYIPEVAWNESSASSGLWATGGGASQIYPKPSWQTAPGVPADGMRDVPDISASAAMHDAYIVQIQNAMYAVGGTSAAAPSLASVMALVNQKAGAAQGNANPRFYALTNLQLTGNGAAVFHDVTSGNNSVPGVAGFNAGAGYDQATGLGSFDANLLVNHWTDASTSNFLLSASVSSLSILQGNSGTVKITLTATPGFNSAVTLSSSGAPAGVSVTFSSPTLTSAAPVTATIAAASSTASGNSSITIIATGAGLTRNVPIALTVVAPTFSFTTSPASTTVSAGGLTTLKLTSTAGAGFNSAIAFSATGLPTGVTASFSPSTIAAPGNGSTTMTLTGSSSALAGTYNALVTAKGASITNTQTVSLTVIVASFTLTAASAKVSLASGGSVSSAVTTLAVNGFKSALTLSVIGLPKGVTASFSPTAIASPGNGSSTLTLRAATNAVSGTSTLSVIASGGGVMKTQPLTLVVTAPAPSHSGRGKLF